MGKGVALLGLILIIVGLLPIIATFLVGIVDLSMILTYFNQGIYSINLAGYLFTEVMLALLGVGVLLLIIGAVK
ncbi:MAG: hypothetical protein JW779_11435 [Candidatus Thorarchaeota archaeon]|nr:hypothetical protein [Candidatus Thorarchaeota archaeon]